MRFWVSGTFRVLWIFFWFSSGDTHDPWLFLSPILSGGHYKIYYVPNRLWVILRLTIFLLLFLLFAVLTYNSQLYSLKKSEKKGQYINFLFFFFFFFENIYFAISFTQNYYFLIIHENKSNHGNKNLMWIKKKKVKTWGWLLPKKARLWNGFFPCIPPPHYYKEKSRTFPGHVTWFNGQILT